MYRYITNLDVPKKWFQSNIDHIMKIYSGEQRLTREDIFLGISRTNVLCVIAHVIVYQ
jgi:abelson tyrosine-protein kinase 1